MGYDTRPADPNSDRHAMLGLWKGALEGASARHDKHRVHYLECPWGAPKVELLEHDGTPVGVAAVQPRAMIHCGEPIAAGLLMDFAVASAHRTVGPALRLQRALLGRCEASYDLVYGFPNINARALSERAGMTCVGQIARFVKVLRYGRYIAPYVPAALAVVTGRLLDAAANLVTWARPPWRGRKVGGWAHASDSEIDELWMATARVPWLMAPRDAARLRWQRKSATLPGDGLMLVRNRAGLSLDGWFECERTQDTLHIVDYWTRDAVAGPGAPLLNTLVREAKSIGCASISVELLAPPMVLKAWYAAGFAERESRPVFVKWTKPSMPTEVLPPIFMTSADEDE